MHKVPRQGVGIVIGIALGIGVGVAIGNLVSGAAVAIAFAFAFESSFKKLREGKDDRHTAATEDTVNERTRRF